jgi:hypothetical protein
MVPFVSTAKETVTGTIIGFHSLIYEKELSVNNKDPHIQLEHDFVLFMADGDHYLLPNIPRSIKIENFHQTARVEGTINRDYRSLYADKFQVKKNKTFRTVWSATNRLTPDDDQYGGH